MKRMNIKGYFALDYVVLVDVPVRDSKFGPVIAIDPEIIEQRISQEIIRQRVPLRGLEIAFIRKTLGLSLQKLADKFLRDPSTIHHWERNTTGRLDLLTEAGLRSVFAEMLDVKLPGKFSELSGEPNVPDELAIEIKAA